MNRVVVQKYLNNKIKIMIYNETICKRQTKTKSKTNRNQSGFAINSMCENEKVLQVLY